MVHRCRAIHRLVPVHDVREVGPNARPPAASRLYARESIAKDDLQAAEGVRGSDAKRLLHLKFVSQACPHLPQIRNASKAGLLRWHRRRAESAVSVVRLVVQDGLFEARHNCSKAQGERTTVQAGSLPQTTQS